MRICERHWAELRQAIDDRDLAPLVSKDGQEAATRFQAMANGSTDPRDFDPLFAANVAIMSYFRAQGGDTTTDHCPICEAQDKSDDDELATNWINGCADDMRAVAISKGLVRTQ